MERLQRINVKRATAEGGQASRTDSPGAEREMNDANARLWPPWLRINRVLRLMLHGHWSAEAWAQVRVEFRKALALRSQIRRAGWFD